MPPECDERDCHAGAAVVVIGYGHELTFCRHHFGTHEVPLTLQGFVVKEVAPWAR